jgi:large subunit ribosomal protein L19
VYYEIKEGNKTRTQFFKGVVIQLRGTGATKTFTIRKMSGDVGVERVFPINMPALQKIEVDRRGKLEDLEFSTSEILEVKKQESKTLLTKSNHSLEK